MSEVDVLVVGAGLAGVSAALRAKELGRSVAVITRGPLGSSLWSGVGDIFGRTSAGPREQLSSRVRRGSTPRTSDELLPAAERVSGVIARFPDHPYQRLRLTPERLSSLVERSLGQLDLPGRVHAFPPLLPTMSGTIRRGDFVLDGISTLDRDLRFVGLEEWPAWDPRWMADLAARSTESTYDHAWAGPSEFLAATPLQVAPKWDAPEEGRVEAIAEAADGRAVVLPAVLGTTFEARVAARDSLSAVGVSASELAGTADSIFGLRLVRHLSARLERAGVQTVQSDGELGGAAGAWSFGEHRAGAVVIATGSQPRAPWQHRLWSASRRPPRNTVPTPWMEQPFLLDGVLTDESLQVDDHPGLFAAGACLDGHDFVHDGTGFGVALVTGWMAGANAAGAIE